MRRNSVHIELLPVTWMAEIPRWSPYLFPVTMPGYETVRLL